MSIPSKVSAASVLTHPHEFSGELAVKNLPRLVQAISGDQGQIKARLVTDRDSGYARLHGRLEGELGVVCPRCGRRYVWPLQAVVDLKLVFSEREEQAALQGGEPYLVENDELPLRDLVEEEVLLALPMLTRCKTCENAVAGAPQKARRKVGPVPESATNNPFAALKDQLKKRS